MKDCMEESQHTLRFVPLSVSPTDIAIFFDAGLAASKDLRFLLGYLIAIMDDGVYCNIVYYVVSSERE